MHQGERAEGGDAGAAVIGREAREGGNVSYLRGRRDARESDERFSKPNGPLVRASAAHGPPPKFNLIARRQSINRSRLKT